MLQEETLAWKKYIYLSNNNIQVLLLPFFSIKKKERMKIKPLLCFIKRKFEIYSNLIKNMQLNNSNTVLKTCVPEFLTQHTFSFDGLCTFNNKLVVQK